MVTYFLFFSASNDDSIYIYKEESLFVCLSVLHAFGHGTNKCDEALQGIRFQPGEGHDGVTTPPLPVGVGVKFHPTHDKL